MSIFFSATDRVFLLSFLSVMSGQGPQVERWSAARDGPLNEENMGRKLAAEGYKCIKYVFSPGKDFPDHSHTETKKDAIIEGQFRFAMHGKEVILQPGDIVEVPQGVIHNATAIGMKPVVFFDTTK